MKHYLKRLIAWTLLLAMLLGLSPLIPLEADAGGIDPEGLGYVDAGQTLRIDIRGDNMYSTTNLIFTCSGNTIATIVGYNANGDEVLNLNVCTSDLFEYFVNALDGYYFEVKVLYGQIRISYNSANNSLNPTLTYTSHDDALEWVVKPNLEEVYLTVDDTAKLDVGQVADGYSAVAASYSYDDSGLARISSNGTIYPQAPGTAEVYMTCKVWISSSQYFYETVTCVVHVVADHSFPEAYADYYTDPAEKYFNIIAYDKTGYRETDFDITVGDTVYNTGSTYWKMIPIPPDFAGSITITKDGYVPYTLSADHLQQSNAIMMIKDQGDAPAIQAVWIRPAGTTEYINTKLQPLLVTSGRSTAYTISYDAYWNGHDCSTVYLQQGSVTLPLAPGENTIALGQYFSSSGGPVYIHALTTDGYAVKTPLLISVGSEITQMVMDYGDPFSAEIEEQLQAVGGAEVKFDLGSTIPVKFTINNDGTVQGAIGLKFSGSTVKDTDLQDIYQEIRNTITKIESADKKGDTAESDRLFKELQGYIKDRDGRLEGKYSTFGFEGSISYMGFFDGKMEDGELTITDVGIIANVSVGGVYSKSTYIKGVLAQWTVKFTEQLEIMISGLTGEQDGELNLLVPTFSNTVSVSGQLSGGIPGTAEATASATGSIRFTYPEESQNFSDGIWTLNLNFHAGVSLFGQEIETPLDWTPIKDHQIWPRETSANSLSLSPISHDYLAAASENTGNGSGETETVSALATTQAVKTTTYLDSTPQLVRLEDMDVLVWIDDNAERDDANSTCLYYAAYDPSIQLWSEPAAVADDGFADFYPQLVTAGDTLYVVWLKADTLLTEDDDLAAIVAAMDIWIAAFDPVQGGFDAPQRIHGGNDLMDQMPRVQLVNDALSVVWVRYNASAFDTQAETQLKTAVYSVDEGWVENTVCAIPGSPDGLAYGSDGTIYYTLNGILYSVTDGTVTAITNGSQTVSAPYICQDTLYYLADGTVTDGEIQIPTDVTSASYALYPLADGSMAALYYAPNANGRQLYATFGSGDNWGEPVALTNEQNAMLSGLTGFCDENGQLRLAANRLTTDPATATQSAELRLITVPQVCDLSLTGAGYLGTTMIRDKSLNTTLFLENSGTAAIGDIRITAWEGETQLVTKVVTLGLQPGDSTEVDMVVPMELLTSDTITFTVQPVSGTDAAQADNTLTLTLALDDISVENMSVDTLPDGTVRATAMFINRGMTDLEGISVVFTKNTSDGEVLATMEVGDVAEGEYIFFAGDLTGLAEGDLLYMTAVMEGEENYIANNTAFAAVRDLLTDSSLVTYAADYSGAQLELDTEYSATLEENVPVTATFTPEEDGYYRICLDAWKGTAESWSPEITGEIYEENNDHPNEWLKFAAYGSTGRILQFSGSQHVYLEGGVTYTLQLTGDTGVLIKVWLEKVPYATTLHIDDITLCEGDHLSESVFVEKVGNCTSDSFVDLVYTSSKPGVAEVDEYGFLLANSPGTAVITAVCRYSGVSTTFTVTVLEREPDGTLTDGQTQQIDTDMGHFYTFTPEQSGYYHITFTDFFRIRTQVPGEHIQWVYCGSGSGSFLLQKGVTYMLYFLYSGDALIERLEPEEMLLEDYFECECDDCPGVMLYRHVPEQDTPVDLYHYSKGDHTLIVYDGNYQVITRFDSGYGGTQEQLVLKKGQTYYFALEHDYASRLGLYEIYGTLCMESGNDAVFVGDTESFYIDYTTDLYAPKLELTLTSSDPSIAKVNADGTVTFLKEGTVTITGKALEGSLVSSMTLTVLPSHKLTLDVPKTLTLDGVSADAAKVSFTPTETDTYVFTIRYQGSDGYWEYYFNMTERSGSNINCLANEDITNGNRLVLELEAGKTYDLRLYYYSYMQKLPIDLTFLVTKADEADLPSDDEVLRLAGAHRWETAIKVADEMKTNLGMNKFDAVIIASGNDFADALAGSYLSTVKNAPILLSWGKGGNYAYLDEDNISYIKSNLAEGGTVYILGGENAVPSSYEEALADYNVKRLGGANRFETNLLILEEAGVSAGEEVLVCTSTNFADSLSASATGKPILLVFNESGSLYGSQPEYLASLSGCTFTVIGGENAVCPALEEAIGAYGTTTRLAGSDRFETSVLVAETYFEAPETAVLAYAWNYPDGLCGGALAYSMDAPLILTMTNYELAAAAYIQGEGIGRGMVLGGDGLISNESVWAIFNLSADDVLLIK